ncbi:MAG: pantetheine-phosphate adenylyltransferase, partial [Actinobacteria bacterium]|nr:pantetheine-phosphate adenylyltransferase [Actinomycetota bacterium]
EIVVGVAASSQKGSGPLFTLEERTELARGATAHLENVSVASFDSLLVDFACELEVSIIIKGLRAVTDFEAEFQMAALNYHLSPGMETLFIMSTPEHMYLSSSVVREIARFKGNVRDLVPPVVADALEKRFEYEC